MKKYPSLKPGIWGAVIGAIAISVIGFSSFGWTLSLIMLVIYFGFILLVAYAPKFLGIQLGTGVTTIGIPIGLFVIVSAFVLTGIYVSKANSKYDTLIRRIVERS